MNLKPLELPPPDSYLIIESYGQLGGWGAVLKYRPAIFSSIKDKRISRYDSGTYYAKITATDAEIIAAIKAMKKFKLFIILEKSFTLKIDYQAMGAFYNKKSKNKLSENRLLKFMDYIIGNGFKVTIEHIKGNNNLLENNLSKIIERSS